MDTHGTTLSQKMNKHFKCQNNKEVIFYNCVSSPNKLLSPSSHTLQDLSRKLTHHCCKPKQSKYTRFIFF